VSPIIPVSSPGPIPILKSKLRSTLVNKTKRDYYEVLGVTRTVSEQEIKTAYRKLAIQFHPDKNSHKGDTDRAEAEERFKEIGEAYAVLSDADKRAAYDRYGHAGVSGAAGNNVAVDPFDLFQQIFSGFGGMGFEDLFGGGGRRGNAAQRGADLRQDLSLEFEEAVFGVSKKVSIRRHEACEKCHGSGVAPGKSATSCRTCGGRGQIRMQQGFFTIARTCTTCHGAGTVVTDPCPGCKGSGRELRERTIEVKVPAGVEDGTRIRYSGEGQAGAHGGPPGDLYVVLHVAEHPFFERDGKNLLCVLPVSISQAALGAEIEIPTLEEPYALKVPEGTQSGTVMRIRNKGVPSLNGRGRGDLMVEVRVQVPTKLNKRQRELLEELAAVSGDQNKADEKGLLDKVKEMLGSS
jgi:molecular chaperone DnaJ